MSIEIEDVPLTTTGRGRGVSERGQEISEALAGLEVGQSFLLHWAEQGYTRSRIAYAHKLDPSRKYGTQREDDNLRVGRIK